MSASCPSCQQSVVDFGCPHCQQPIALNELETGSEKLLVAPPDVTLPFFAYGLFKPGELAFGQVRDYVEGVPTRLTAAGSLHVRDGIPLLQLGTAGQVEGYILVFTGSQVGNAPINRLGHLTGYEQITWDG